MWHRAILDRAFSPCDLICAHTQACGLGMDRSRPWRWIAIPIWENPMIHRGPKARSIPAWGNTLGSRPNKKMIEGQRPVLSQPRAPPWVRMHPQIRGLKARPKGSIPHVLIVPSAVIPSAVEGSLHLFLPLLFWLSSPEGICCSLGPTARPIPAQGVALGLGPPTKQRAESPT